MLARIIIIIIKATILKIMETKLNVEIGMEIMVEEILEQGEEVIQDMELEGDNGMEIREVIKAEVDLLDLMEITFLDLMEMDLLLVSIILEEEVAEVSCVRSVSSQIIQLPSAEIGSTKTLCQILQFKVPFQIKIKDQELHTW